eukprot:CAMPEP_0185604636 /NCGR_PEP_ID=MMETSP0436-20130131/3447_1 /TAXON_ID=626734 ORGANISM="Favella taraikaensis, Strain Fe Narragansett Bay" /NCGR_SAMPLE_ID=MMETSP0436 /ASSEMBLY_ACC=CAM_ASM_000390 /LENGTH=53 /DNA_ID=CAMNT_0028235559 /DNA_START=18 /DNA_END=179 /DNA_ORIENTATION=+
MVEEQKQAAQTTTPQEEEAAPVEPTPEELAEQARKVQMWNDSQTMPEMGAFDR